MIKYEGNRSYNISLGDVDYVLDKIGQNYDIAYMTQFVFAIKTIYSMSMYDFFEDKEENWEFRKNILIEELDNESNIYDEITFKRMQRINRLMIFSNYEKFLGGNLLRVANIFKDIQSVSNQFIHIRPINTDLLLSLYNYSLGNSDSFSPLIDKNLAFKICEFFMLTTYTQFDNAYFRSQKRCYYYTFPIPINSSTEYIYSSTSILFNIVKFYNYYRLYYTMKSEESINETNFMKFWHQIEVKRDKSLIYNLLYHKYESDLHDQNNGNFQNKKLERIFIRNMEVLDNLQNYLLFLKSRYRNDKHKIKSSNILINFYKKLCKFEFYIYPKDLINNYQSDNKIKSKIQDDKFDKTEIEDDQRIIFNVYSHIFKLLDKEIYKNAKAREIFEKILFNDK